MYDAPRLYRRDLFGIDIEPDGLEPRARELYEKR